MQDWKMKDQKVQTSLFIPHLPALHLPLVDHAWSYVAYSGVLRFQSTRVIVYVVSWLPAAIAGNILQQVLSVRPFVCVHSIL